jgi:hypothetical protein
MLNEHTNLRIIQAKIGEFLELHEAVREHEAQCDQLVINLCLRALTQVPWSPATTTFSYLHLSFALPMGISMLPIPTFCMLSIAWLACKLTISVFLHQLQGQVTSPSPILYPTL